MLSIHVKQLIVLCDSASESDPCKIASRRLARLKKGLSTVNKAIGSLSGGPDDVCLHQ